jgi:hypothetical protein
MFTKQNEGFGGDKTDSHQDNLVKISIWIRAKCPEAQLGEIRHRYLSVLEYWQDRSYMFPMLRVLSQMNTALQRPNPNGKEIERLWASILAFRRQQKEKANAKNPVQNR